MTMAPERRTQTPLQRSVSKRVFGDANAARATTAAQRNLELARRLIEWHVSKDAVGVPCPQSGIDVAAAIVAHPGESWPRLADRLGMSSKYVAASAFRRALIAAGLRDR
jgi:hypothetical protein